MNLTAKLNFSVIDESDDWIVVDKAAPLIVHPANNKPEPTLLGGVQALCSYEIANGGVLGIINRLDRETSGLVLIAKHTGAARELGMIFERREAQKEYLAIVHGWPGPRNWVCNEPLGRQSDFEPSNIWVRQMIHPRGKPSSTSFQVLEHFEKESGKYSLVRCRPHTGRMHQIRVHLAQGGHPIAGDKIYTSKGDEYLEWMAQGWTKSLSEKLPLTRLALHSLSLKVPWKEEDVLWETDFPSDFSEFMDSRSSESAADVAIWRSEEV